MAKAGGYTVNCGLDQEGAGTLQGCYLVLESPQRIDTSTSSSGFVGSLGTNFCLCFQPFLPHRQVGASH